MSKQITLLALLVGCALNVEAATSPFFTITETAVGAEPSEHANYQGPWAAGITRDGQEVLSLKTRNEPSQFFSSVPFADFLVDRYRFEYSCMLDNNVCDGYWNDMETEHQAYDWRRDHLDGVPQRSNTGFFSLSQHDSTITPEEEFEFGENKRLVTAVGDDANTFVGYRMEENAFASGEYYHRRNGFAVIEGREVALNSNYQMGGGNSLSIPTGVFKVGEAYIVTGTVAVGQKGFYECYEGDDDDYGDYEYCPGFDTQAAFWFLKNATAQPQLVLSPSYVRTDNSALLNASARSIAEFNGKYYAVGYSADTDDDGSDEVDGRNIAVFWELNIGESAMTIGDPRVIPLSLGRPSDDNDDDGPDMRHSWTVDVNKNGYVVGNQWYNHVKNRNRPIEAFVYRLDNQSANGDIPFKDAPIEGAGSEVMAINDQNVVVGWRDARNLLGPVDDGTNRMQEAFVFKADNTAQNWYINDLLCNDDGNGGRQCQQNGYYYHIAYAVDIAENGNIAAVAYRYASQDDLETRTNATIVSVKLTPADASYNTAGDYLVDNAPVEQVNDNGGGSLFWLTLLMAPIAWLRRRKV